MATSACDTSTWAKTENEHARSIFELHHVRTQGRNHRLTFNTYVTAAMTTRTRVELQPDVRNKDLIRPGARQATIAPSVGSRDRKFDSKPALIKMPDKTNS